MPWPEFAAALTYFFIPALMLLGTSLTTGYFTSRYAISAVIGVAVLFPYVLGATCGRRVLAPVAFMAGVLLLWGQQTVATPPQPVVRTPEFKARSPLYPRNDDLPIAVADVTTFVQSAHYVPPRVAKRLTYLVDAPYAQRRERFLGEVSVAGDRQLMPGTVVDYGPFVRTHSKFWVYTLSRSDIEWLPPRLMAEGWKLELKGQNGHASLFLATRE